MRYPLNRSIVITNPFGAKTQWYSFHTGVDLRASYIPLVAPEAGRINKIWRGKAEGLALEFIGATGIHHFYHLSNAPYAPGLKIGEGGNLGTTGNSGAWTSAPHLHWGLKINNEWVDPTKYVKGDEMTEEQFEQFVDRFNSIDNSLVKVFERLNLLEGNVATRFDEIQTGSCSCDGTYEVKKV